MGPPLAVSVTAAESPLYANPQAPLEQRVSDLLSRLTLEEKAGLCHGGFISGGVPRLGIGQLAMLDGRQGLRPVGDKKGMRTTSLPCALALSCTWDEAAAREFGQVLAEEMLALNQHVLLAPMVNLVRSPLGGRNFENFGEDPCLAGQIASAYIRGVQEQRVGACACLLVANDCEARRHFTSSNMDDRTLRELHLLGYEMCVREGRVWSMMSGNNLLNGVHCAHNHRLLQELMKDEIGFDGVMITDWRAAYDTVPAALAGTDMTTGICGYVFGEGRLLAAIKNGEVPPALLDEKVRRILRLYLRCGVLDPAARARGGLDTPEHRQAARRLAAEGMVLLRNRGQLLPLDAGKLRRILITGPAADSVLQGGGSGNVPAAVEVSPLQGLQAALAGETQITHLPYAVSLRPALGKAAIEWEQAASAQSKKGKKKKGPAALNQPPGPATLSQAAQAADAVIFVAAGTLASEGRDLADMNLPGGQAEAIAALARANTNVIVILVNNGAVSLEPWGDEVPAILAIHYAGQATGDALADVLTGKVNPGGKLTYTFARRLQDYPCHALGEWPARLILDKDPVNPGMKPEERKATRAFDTEYNEGVFAGYRWFDDKQIEPWFPFGHGLSYTTFELSSLKVTETSRGIRVVCTVKNTGSRAGAEVVQVYVAPPKSSVPRPPRELKGFAKAILNAGESRALEILLRPSALAFYDVVKKKWKAEVGDYQIQAGTSSRDIRLRASHTLRADRYYDHF
ncbi:MAG TPA: glycoside hydrolase family 3 C-terminal domain-containing protein [Candidatus Paceibacterota bacterium]|nr:glycoside hydrolase family 3 C-terminal domain-containing protein [Verrucomicrobiota bacterium]HSA09539.1 glycoside hydrolase family 3 C-terminal domain-containing protein [Candidatus Paceibacterota bacterium]